MTGAKPDRNPAIEGLRGLLATAVVGFHVYNMGCKAGFYTQTNNPLVAKLGPYAVCLFFCVSGFLITQTLLAKASVREFLINRALRIYPVFLILHLVMFMAGPFLRYEWMGTLRHSPGAWATAFISNALFLPGIFDLPLAQKNAWSLSYEALFYVLAAGIYASGVCQRRWLRYCGLGGFLAIAGLTLWARPLSVFFVVGLAVFRCFQSPRRSLPKRLDVLAVIALAAGLCLLPYSAFASAAFVLVFFYAVVGNAGKVGAALSARPMQWLGKRSYSLYLLHPFLLDPARRALAHASVMHGHTALAGMAFLVAGSLMAIAASHVFFSLIEIKLTRFIRGRQNRNQVEAPRLKNEDPASDSSELLVGMVYAPLEYSKREKSPLTGTL